METWLLQQFHAMSLDESVAHIDSISLTEIVLDFEDEFKLKLDFTKLPKKGTIRDILNFAEQQRGN